VVFCDETDRSTGKNGGVIVGGLLASVCQNRLTTDTRYHRIQFKFTVSINNDSLPKSGERVRDINTSSCTEESHGYPAEYKPE
jgi:hypothetical protein